MFFRPCASRSRDSRSFKDPASVADVPNRLPRYAAAGGVFRASCSPPTARGQARCGVAGRGLSERRRRAERRGTRGAARVDPRGHRGHGSGPRGDCKNSRTAIAELRSSSGLHRGRAAPAERAIGRLVRAGPLPPRATGGAFPSSLRRASTGKTSRSEEVRPTREPRSLPRRPPPREKRRSYPLSSPK